MKKDSIKNLRIIIIVLSVVSVFLMFGGAAELKIKTVAQVGSQVGYTEIIDIFSVFGLAFKTPSTELNLTYADANPLLLVMYFMPIVYALLTFITRAIESNKINMVIYLVIAILFVMGPLYLFKEIREMHNYFYRILLDGTQILDVRVKPDTAMVMFAMFSFAAAFFALYSIGVLAINEFISKGKNNKRWNDGWGPI